MAKFITLTKRNYDKITVNTDNISTIERLEVNFFSSDITLVTLRDGTKLEVRGSKEYVEGLLK